MHAGNNLDPLDLYIDYETEVKPNLGSLIGGWEYFSSFFSGMFRHLENPGW
jgi:hypothetical protein